MPEVSPADPPRPPPGRPTPGPGAPAPDVARPARPDPAFWGADGSRRLPRPVGTGFAAFTDRLAAWRTDARAGVALLAIAAVIAGVVWYRVGVGGSDPPRARTSTTAATQGAASAGTASTVAASDRVVVHVAGAVATPGVVELGADARVIDAIEAAGGAVPDADLDRLNLAAKLNDGQRVLVQRVGEPAAPPTPGGTVGDPSADPSVTGGLLDLNTATSLQLEELPGIGPALAAAIIAERERRGGFRSVNELRDVRGIGEQRFADLQDKVTV